MVLGLTSRSTTPPGSLAICGIGTKANPLASTRMISSVQTQGIFQCPLIPCSLASASPPLPHADATSCRAQFCRFQSSGQTELQLLTSTFLRSQGRPTVTNQRLKKSEPLRLHSNITTNMSHSIPTSTSVVESAIIRAPLSHTWHHIKLQVPQTYRCCLLGVPC